MMGNFGHMVICQMLCLYQGQWHARSYFSNGVYLSSTDGMALLWDPILMYEMRPPTPDNVVLLA